MHPATAPAVPVRADSAHPARTPASDLLPHLILSGRVENQIDGQPVAHARVGAIVRRGAREIAHRSVLTGADGTFALADLPPWARCDILVEAAGFARARLQNVTLRTFASRLPDILLTPLSSVAVVVTDAAGGPLPGARVYASWVPQSGKTMIVGRNAPHATAGPQGQARITGIRWNPFRLLAFAPGYALTVAGPLTPDLRRPVRLRLPRGLTVRVRVSGPDARGLAGAKVIIDKDPWISFTCTTDENGVAEPFSVTRGSDLGITVSADGYGQLHRRITSYDGRLLQFTFQHPAVRPGLRIDCPESAASPAGRTTIAVLERTSRALERFRLATWEGSIHGRRLATALGRFEVRAINPQLGFARSPSVLVGGRGDALVRLHFDSSVLCELAGIVEDQRGPTRATVILERLFDPDLWPASGWERRRGIGWQQVACVDTDQRGRFRCRGLLPGRYRLSAANLRGAGSLLFDLHPGDRLPALRIAVRGGRLSGRVLPPPRAGDSLYVPVRAGSLEWDPPIDSAGSFTVNGLPPGRVQLRVRERRPSPNALAWLAWRADRAHSVTIRAGATTQVTLFRQEREEANAVVELRWTDPPRPGLRLDLLGLGTRGPFGMQVELQGRAHTLFVPESRLWLAARIGPARDICAWRSLRCAAGARTRIRLKDERVLVRVSFVHRPSSSLRRLRFTPRDLPEVLLRSPGAPRISLEVTTDQTRARIPAGHYELKAQLETGDWVLIERDLVVADEPTILTL